MSKQELLNRKVMWGASTSAYQVEGGFDQDGKGPSVQDVRTVPEGTTDFKVASDHYNHLEEDVALFKELGLQSYRFSIAWTRIFPEGHGAINQKGVDFYHRLLDLLLAAGIEPVATVFHFDLPYAIHQEGGWSNRQTIEYFTDYCAFLFNEYGSKIKYWLTINEQNMLTLAGAVLSGNRKTPKQIYQENHHMLVAQAKVMKYYHDKAFDGVIGPAPNISAVYSKTSKPEDQLAADNLSAFRNWLYLDAAVFGVYNHQVLNMLRHIGAEPDITEEDKQIMRDGRCDFIALNYYSSCTAESYSVDQAALQGDQQKGHGLPGFFKMVGNDNLKKTEFNWEIDPLGFKITLHQVYSRYNLPLMITENGIGAYDTLTADLKIHDLTRISYLRDHIGILQETIEEGVNVLGYYPWSAIDLVSTHEGIRKRYGFIYVNRDEFDLMDLKRYRKDSFFWYNRFIVTGDLENEAYLDGSE